MSDYQKMYMILFNKITDVIEELQEIQKEAEEIFIRDSDNIIILKDKKEK